MTKMVGDAFYLSGSANSLAAWIRDDDVYTGNVDAGVGFSETLRHCWMSSASGSAAGFSIFLVPIAEYLTARGRRLDNLDVEGERLVVAELCATEAHALPGFQRANVAGSHVELVWGRAPDGRGAKSMEMGWL